MTPSFIYSLAKDLWHIWQSRRQHPFTFTVNEEVVTYDEKMRSLKMDVVKVNAHDHLVGVAAEYAWLDKTYPKYKRLRQSLTSLGLIKKSVRITDDIYFDILLIELDGGRTKEVYFDITEFFPNSTASVTRPTAYAAGKLTKLYR